MSHPEAPNGPSFDGQNEAAAPPPPEVVTSHAGAAAVNAETQSQEPTVGEATLGQIRDMFRDGTIPASRGSQRPPIIREHPAEHQRMTGIITSWRAQFEPNDTMADAVAQRMSTTWVKVAAVQQNPSLLVDEDRLVGTLTALYSDTRHASQDLGLGNNGARAALYNSREELHRAKELAERSPYLRPSDFKACASAAPADVLSRTRQAHLNVEAVLTTSSPGTRANHPAVTRSLINRMALRKPTAEECVSAVDDYAGQVDTLTTKYKDNPLVTQERIRLACATQSNPGKFIEDKLETAESLTAQYKGRYGLSEYDVVNVTFKSENPKQKLDDTIAAIPVVCGVLQDRLSEAKVRDLVLTTADPIEEGRAILRRADTLKTQLADNPDVQQVFSDRDYVRFAENGGNDATAAAEYARRVVTARRHFADNPRATEAVIRRASRESGDVVQNTEDLIQTARRLTATYAREDVPVAVINQAVSNSGNPDGHVQDFLRDRENAQRQFGGRISRGVINDTSVHTGDPVDELGRRMSTYNRERRDPANSHISDDELMRRVCRSPLDESVKPYNADTIMEDMQRHSREHRRGGSRAHLDESYREHINQVREQIADWVDDFISINEGIDQNRVVDRFTRMYYNYIRYGEELDLTTDPQMLRAVFEDYCNYVRELARHKFENPEAVAQFNPRKKVLEQSADRTKELRRVMRDNFGSVDSNRLLGNRLRNRFPGKVDAEFQDRLDALSDDERALINNRLRDQADPEEERRLRERLRTDDLDDYYNDLLRYLKLRDDTESRPTSPPTAPNGPASPPHPVYDRYNEEQRRRDTAPATGGGQGSLVQEVKSDLDRAMYILEEEFANGAVARAVDRLDAGIVGLSGAAMRAQAAIEDLERRQRSLNVDIAYAENHTPEGQTGPDEALVQRLYAQNEAIKAELRTLRAMQSGANSAIGSLSDAIDHANHSRGVSQTIVGDVKAYRTDI